MHSLIELKRFEKVEEMECYDTHLVGQYFSFFVALYCSCLDLKSLLELSQLIIDLKRDVQLTSLAKWTKIIQSVVLSYKCDKLSKIILSESNKSL